MSETGSDTVLKSTRDVSLVYEPLCIEFAFTCVLKTGDKRNESDGTKDIS